MTKAERKINQQQRQFKALAALAKLVSGKEVDGQSLFRKLRRIEVAMGRKAVDLANGTITMIKYNEFDNQATQKVTKYFGGKRPKGFFINSDPRGCSLKINDDVMREPKFVDIGLQRDAGGYGLLAPEITGN